MSTNSKATNKGGPAARQGFKYQDHVAAQLLLRMLIDRYALRVECETADDIVYVSQPLGIETFEYVQVKTTENNHKWSYTEITALDNKKKETSLVQKSLLCDTCIGNAKFRIVTKRGVYKDLEFLTLEYTQRKSPALGKSLGARLVKKFKSTISKNGRDLSYWANNCIWQIAGEVLHLEAQNLKDLSEFCEKLDFVLPHSQLKILYEKILEIADNAAVANAISEPDKKIIKKEILHSWLQNTLADFKKLSKPYAKPYRESPERFLVEFHSFFDSNIPKGVRGFDVEYDFEEWRCADFAKHLTHWLPEFALKPSELVAFGHHNAISLISKAYTKLAPGKVEQEKIIGEIILHSLLRTILSSEPIACKVFYVENGSFSSFGNAHIVHNSPPNSDELWLGQAKLVAASDYKIAIDELAMNLESAITKATLAKEKDIIVSLREANHLMPVTQQLDDALANNAKLEDLLKVLCFPIMLAYDSTTLSKGFSENYLDLLKVEIIEIYQKITSKFSGKIDKIKVVVFLVPIECAKTLAENFRKECEKI